MWTGNSCVLSSQQRSGTCSNKPWIHQQQWQDMGRWLCPPAVLRHRVPKHDQHPHDKQFSVCNPEAKISACQTGVEDTRVRLTLVGSDTHWGLNGPQPEVIHHDQDLRTEQKGGGQEGWG